MLIAHAMLTVFGLGHLRPASGTWGSTPPPLLAFALVTMGTPQWQVETSIALMGLLFAIACIRFGRWAEERFQRKDPGEVVADEVAGQCLVLLFLPWQPGEAWLANAAIAGFAFLLFRFFDIIKPAPARTLQRLKQGWGILVDDLIAGFYAAIVCQVALRIGLPLLMGG